MTTPCPPIPSTDPDWPEPTLCQHEGCAAIRRDAVRTRPNPAEVTVLCLWLIHHLDAIRQDEAAGELLADLRALRAELRAAVDNRAYRYAGPCRAVLRPVEVGAESDGDVILPTVATGDQRPCGADLRHRVGAPTIVCKVCGAEYDAAEQSTWNDKASADGLAPGPVIAKALAEAGYKIKAATIRNWAERTREWVAKAARRQDGDPPLQYEPHPIEQVACQVGTGLPLYRVGQVLARVKADPARRPESERITA